MIFSLAPAAGCKRTPPGALPFPHPGHPLDLAALGPPSVINAAVSLDIRKLRGTSLFKRVDTLCIRDLLTRTRRLTIGLTRPGVLFADFSNLARHLVVSARGRFLPAEDVACLNKAFPSLHTALPATHRLVMGPDRLFALAAMGGPDFGSHRLLRLTRNLNRDTAAWAAVSGLFFPARIRSGFHSHLSPLFNVRAAAAMVKQRSGRYTVIVHAITPSLSYAQSISNLTVQARGYLSARAQTDNSKELKLVVDLLDKVETHVDEATIQLKLDLTETQLRQLILNIPRPRN